MHQSGVQIEVENHWVPQLTHENDWMLMDKAIREGFTTQDLQGINMCRMYLQVFTLSDITTAKGDCLLPEISHDRHLQRSSPLVWPNIPNPPERFWRMWRRFLQYLARAVNSSSH